MTWEHFGYDSEKPCEICGKKEYTKSEPRFNYVVCEEHSTMSPVEISKYKSQEENEDE